MAQDFMAVAERHSIAVVHMNQVTTKIQEGQESMLIPALGDSWGHAASTRVILYWDSNHQRLAHVFKSPSMPPATVPFLVCQDGIRGLRPQPAVDFDKRQYNMILSKKTSTQHK